MEDNLFVWHFTVRGPKGTDFAGGIYHGRISLPPEYPFKPPSIMLLTPNGRFETNKKICLSLTAHHPEHWQPAWGIRTILEALIACDADALRSRLICAQVLPDPGRFFNRYFQIEPDEYRYSGALQWRPDERIALAASSSVSSLTRDRSCCNRTLGLSALRTHCGTP